MSEKMEKRAVRVFVSSTFCDMQAERNELSKYTFPELRRRCKERDLELTEVDLRWGVTEEQSNRGEVLPICLAEIERCRPYFICHLGERYGFVPKMIDDDLKEEHPWLKEHDTKSYTALEIIHGVLNNPPMKPRSFFYFRDPQESAKVEKSLKKESGYEEEPQALKDKLIALKADIRTFAHHDCHPVHENYPDAKAFGEMVLDDLWFAIDKRFPEGSQPTKQERQRMDNEAFAEIRRKVYIGRDEYFKKLNDHVAGDGSPLLITGESGIGKSALISNWMEQYRTANPDDFMINRFIGGTAESADYVFLLRSIMIEIKDRYQEGKEDKSEELRSIAGENEDDIPTDPKKVVEAFPLWLAKASAMEAHKGNRFILILDGLNQLNDQDNASTLTWLPQYINPNTRLILSTLPGASMDALTKREWPEYEVKPMNMAEREQFIIDYLKQFTKELSREQRDLIVEAEQSANPLYTKTLLEELKLFGYHEKLTEKIEYYLKAETVEELFTKVLARYEKDYDRDREGLTQEAMSLIWASRHGLTEDEFLTLLGTDGEKLPQVFWSPLYLAAEEFLVNRSGLLSFFHDFMRKAVESRYLKHSDERQKAHLRIADYFEKRELDERKVSELPWQLERAEEWERLKDCIAEPKMFLNLSTDEKKYELTGYWLSIGDLFDMVDTYNSTIEKYEAEYDAKGRLAILIHQVSQFFLINAKHERTEPLLRRLLTINDKSITSDHCKAATSLNALAVLLMETDRFNEAEPLFRRALKIDGGSLGSTIILSNLAMLLKTTGHFKEAEQLFRRAAKIDEQNNHPNIARDFSNLAMLLLEINRYKEVESLLRRALKINEKSFGPVHPEVSIILNNLSVLLMNTKRFKEAETFSHRALKIHEKMLGSDHPLTAKILSNMALILMMKSGHDKEVERLFRRALKINEKSLGPVHHEVALALNNLAGLLANTDRLKEAEPLLRRALKISEKSFASDHSNVAKSLNNLGNLYLQTNEHKKAEESLCGALRINEKIFGPNHPEVATVLENLGILRYVTSHQKEAGSLLARALEIKEKKFGFDHSSIALTLNIIGKLYFDSNHLAKAKSSYHRALEIYEKSLGSDHPDTKAIKRSLRSIKQVQLFAIGFSLLFMATGIGLSLWSLWLCLLGVPLILMGLLGLGGVLMW